MVSLFHGIAVNHQLNNLATLEHSIRKNFHSYHALILLVSLGFAKVFSKILFFTAKVFYYMVCVYHNLA